MHRSVTAIGVSVAVGVAELVTVGAGVDEGAGVAVGITFPEAEHATKTNINSNHVSFDICYSILMLMDINSSRRRYNLFAGQ